MSAIPYPSSNVKPILLQILRAIVIGGFLFFLGLAASLAAVETSYANRIYPGVMVAGIDLSGLSPVQAAAQISQQIDYPQHGHILLHDGGTAWTASPAELGFFVDPESSALNAFQIGHTGSLLQRFEEQYDTWFVGKSLPATFVFDQRVAQRYLLALAGQIDHPVIEASLGLQGADVVVHSGQVGRSLDTNATLALLSSQLTSLRDGAISLPVQESAPIILDANEQAALARTILSSPLVLSIPDSQKGDPGPWTFDPASLAKMLSVERVQSSAGAKYQVVLNTDTLHTFLANLAPALTLQSKMPRLTFNETSNKLEVLDHAVIGRTLNVDATVQSINEKLAQGEHSIPLVFNLTPPAVTDASTGDQLGIKELVHSETSYFYGSSAARVQNITTAAGRFNGVLVAPGQVFSMSDTLGDISLDNGYAEALIILGNQTIAGVGGGVCQVSTTLFRTAFFAGYQIVERHAHAYRVLYYEKIAGNKVNPNFAGLDATVYVPLVDFKFKNDSPNWLLMETVVNPAASSITWKFFSTPDGRTVDWKTTGLTNITPPPDPVYNENPALKKGEIKQVDWKVEGADVTVNRTVNKDGKVYIQDSFYTHFQPWRDIYEYGPGTDGIPTPTPKP